MPVRVDIHVSLVSKKVAKSSLLTVSEGNALPVPIIFIVVFKNDFRCKSRLLLPHRRKKVVAAAKKWRKMAFWDEKPRF